MEMQLMADVADFLTNWYGILIFVLADVLIGLLIVAVAYRYVFKVLFDFLFGLAAGLVCLPFLLLIAVGKKLVGKGKVFQRDFFAGKHGKRITLYSIAIPEREEDRSAFDRFLYKTGLRKLPYVYALVLLQFSIVGVKPLSVVDEKFVAEEDYDRFLVRPGFINPLVRTAPKEDRTYEEMFASDMLYAKKYRFFGDISILFVAFLHKIRGDKGNIFGEAEKRNYADILLERGEIGREEYDEAIAEEEAYLAENYPEREIEEETEEDSEREPEEEIEEESEEPEEK